LSASSHNSSIANLAYTGANSLVSLRKQETELQTNLSTAVDKFEKAKEIVALRMELNICMHRAPQTLKAQHQAMGATDESGASGSGITIGIARCSVS
jgi:hypothetical protein